MSNSRRFRRQNRHEPPPPPWRVIAVGEHIGGWCSNPDCQEEHGPPPKGGDLPPVGFAYTVGLHDVFDLPELHLPAYPTEGDAKPLGAEAMCATLNLLGTFCVSGDAGPGHVEHFPLCEHQTLIFTLGEPGPLEAVSAFQCSDHAEVIPVHWRIDVHEHVS